MRIGIVVFPGTNCESDCFWVVKNFFNQDVSYIWHKETKIENFDCLILPGGFSYGDYLRAGTMARCSSIMEEIKSFSKGGGLVIGICNGFQILLEAGLLPGVLLKNKGLKFICKQISISIENNETPFTSKSEIGKVLNMPVRHAEGRYYIENDGLMKLVDNKQIVMKYCSPNGEISGKYNFNGSIENIAGICNKEKNIFGLMPHPEAAVDLLLGSDGGKVIFDSIISCGSLVS